MTSTLTEFVRDLREAWVDDPVLNLDNLPTEILELIPVCASYRKRPRLEWHLRIGGAHFYLRVPQRRRIRASKLRAMIAAETDLLGEHARGSRQQTAALQAEAASPSALASARAPAGRLAVPTADGAGAEGRYHELLVEQAALLGQVRTLTAKNKALDDELAYMEAIGPATVGANAELIKQVERAAANQAAAEKQLSDLTLALRREREAVSAAQKSWDGERSRYATQVHDLISETAWLSSENSDLRQQVGVLAGHRDELERTNQWLQEKLRFRDSSGGKRPSSPQPRRKRTRDFAKGRD